MGSDGTGEDAGGSVRVSLADWERDATAVLSPTARDYVLVGAMDERTIEANDRQWRDWWLRPHVLTGAGEPDPTVELFGRRWPHPVLAAPTARHALVHEGAEVATATGLAATGTTMTVSSSASRPLEQVVAPLDHWWMQLYLPADERLRAAMVEEAVARGAEALVVTVDLPESGRREAPLRAGRPGWPGDEAGSLWDTIADRVGVDSREYLQPLGPEHVTWLAGHGLPVVVKGVLRGDDARRAVDAGAAAVQVSNHGGRQLDGAVPTARALPDVLAAVGDQVPVLVDGGIRRGADVATALALGATAVAVGRPVVWGLALEGAEGVAAVLHTLVDETRHVLRLLGVEGAEDLTPDLLLPAG